MATVRGSEVGRGPSSAPARCAKTQSRLCSTSQFRTKNHSEGIQAPQNRETAPQRVNASNREWREFSLKRPLLSPTTFDRKTPWHDDGAQWLSYLKSAMGSLTRNVMTGCDATCCTLSFLTLAWRYLAWKSNSSDDERKRARIAWHRETRHKLGELVHLPTGDHVWSSPLPSVLSTLGLLTAVVTAGLGTCTHVAKSD
ncbi:hypothetical protein BCV70DRAFT_196680 [Testicularia cyperi]|uniref:Uncharacterized protein n=1 Tax=Testicularia cyperi TaxID=1882483 RepID=A0A317XWY2_9BASI|nr:hypothetical protein BCV70DRAFT_196680 [Testicularia cyperi]